MSEKKIVPVSDIGYFILGNPNIIFVEGEAEARALVDGSPPPTEAIKISKVHMFEHSGMALNHIVILTQAARERYNTDPVWAKKLKDAL